MATTGVHGHRESGVRAGPILAVLCASQLVLAVDLTIVAVANPSIQRGLGFADAQLQWNVTAYALTFGGFLLLGGRMADLYGRRRLYLVGLTGFTLASIAAAGAQSPVQLIAARGGQGLFAALISPCTLALLTSTFAEGPTRQRAFGIWASAGSVGGIVGFLLGGAMTQFLGWRSIFLLNGPIGAIAILGAAMWLPRDESVARKRVLDVPGAIVVTLGSGSVIYGVGQAQTHGWGAPQTFLPILLAGVLLGLFVGIELRAAEPLLPARVLRRRAALANIHLTCLATLSNSVIFLSSIYLQRVFGYSAGTSGAATLGLPLGFAVGVNVGSRTIAHLGIRRQAVIGFLLLGGSVGWLARTPDHASFVSSFLPGITVLGIGLGIALLPLVTVITTGVASDDQGIVAGVYGMSQQMGGAIGLAVLSIVAASGGARGAAGAARTVAQQAHALRLALGGAASIALVAVVLSVIALPGVDARGTAPAPGGEPLVPLL